MKVLEKKNVELKMVKVKQDIECINGRVILLETWNKKKIKIKKNCRLLNINRRLNC